MSSFTEKEIAYIRSQRLGRLATLSADGSPHQTVVAFYYNAELDTIDIGGRNMGQSKKYRDAIQAVFHSNVNYVLAGQFAAPPAYRSDLKGMIPFSLPVFWNVRRE